MKERKIYLVWCSSKTLFKILKIKHKVLKYISFADRQEQ